MMLTCLTYVNLVDCLVGHESAPLFLERWVKMDRKCVFLPESKSDIIQIVILAEVVAKPVHKLVMSLL